MSVDAPQGAEITAVCLPRGCERFHQTVTGPASRKETSVTTIAGHGVPYGIRLRIVVARPDIGKVTEYRTVRRGSNSLRQIRFERCRPPGSRVAAADLSAPCP